MEHVLKWYEKEALYWRDLDALMENDGFHPMGEIAPTNPEQSKYIKVRDKIAILLNNGIVSYFTITALSDVSGTYIVGVDEPGTSVKGMEFCIDSGFFRIYDKGYKVLEKFPWEE